MSPPFLLACPKYASKSYSSCASHILSFCFISVPSFIEISHGFQVIEGALNCMENNQISVPSFIEISHGFQVIEGARNCMENNQREITPKI